LGAFSSSFCLSSETSWASFSSSLQNIFFIPLYAKAIAPTPVAKNHAVRSVFFPDSSFHFSLSQTLFRCSETKFLVEAQIHGFSSEGLAFSVVLI
jgi:hypothetical protein